MSRKSFPIFKNPLSKNKNKISIQLAGSLFGHRFTSRQSNMNLLLELLLVISSKKKIDHKKFSEPLPDMNTLRTWPDEKALSYAPKQRLNLKLFAFMHVSQLDKCSEAEQKHLEELEKELHKNIIVSGANTPDEIVRTLENLFLGFQTAASTDQWYDQNFMPISSGVLACETSSNTKKSISNAQTWDKMLEDKNFDATRHNTLARGGEVLYLQLCNALRQDPKTISEWAKESCIEITPEEENPETLHQLLQTQLQSLLDRYSEITTLADYIDSGIEAETAKKTDYEKTAKTTDDEKDLRYVEAAYCIENSWKEGYIFAVELLRLCKSNLDCIKQLQLMEIACAMQVLRTLCVQSTQYCNENAETHKKYQTTWPGYRLVVSAPNEKSSSVKEQSRHTVNIMKKTIYNAICLRYKYLQDNKTIPNDETNSYKNIKNANVNYGSKVFIKIGQELGLIVPRHSLESRFTLNEQILRMLVVTTIPIGERFTYNRFKKIVEARHGLVFDTHGLKSAHRWTNDVERIFVDSIIDVWLQEMLEASGLLIRLSDSCAIVENPDTMKGSKE